MPSYSTLLDTYSQGIPCPPCFSFPTHVLDKWSAYDPNLLAILWVAPDFSKEVKVTYRDLEGLSHRSAVVLAGLGVKKGDRVLIQLPRVVEWWTVVFGLLRIGAVPVPGTSLLMSKDLKFRATSSKAIAFIGDSSACERFEEVAGEVGVKTIVQVRVDGDGGLGAGRVDFHSALKGVAVGTRYVGESLKSTDLAMLYFTSGTTGNPKQVLLENEYLLGHTITGHWYRLGVGKLFLNLADAGWAKFGYSTFGAFNHGATLVIQPPAPGPFSPLSVLSLLHKYPITTLCCPPTIYRSLVTSASKEYYRTNPPIALEHCVGAGEPLNPSVIVEFKELSGGIEICDGWGQTETIILVGNWEGETIRPGSMGQVAPGGFEVNVIGPKGEEMGVGEEGELAVRTDCGAGSKWIFKGYVKGDGSVDKREKEYAGKRWYCTGDRGTRDADGYFWFVGRDDDVITSAGYRIGPFEVESALKEHPAVLESAAVASPDAERHEIVKAFIILSAEYASRLSPLSPSARSSAEKALIVEIQNHVKKTAAPYKYPREIEFVNSLPLTVSGKIRRLELRNLEYQRKEHIAKALKARL